MTSTEDPAVTPNSRHERFTLLAVCGATLMLLVDVTIVQVALPAIQRELRASFSDQEWVISAYALTLAALLLMTGTLADRFGRKRMFCVGVAAFSLASLACGLAPNAAALIIARGVQGVGGAAMFATALALIGQEFEGPARARAIAAWGATVGAAVAIGPLAGGILTSAFGWRWIFFVNVPIGATVLFVSARELHNVGDPDARRLDTGGVVTFSAMLTCLVLALVRGQDDGFLAARILALFAAAAALLVAFVALERRRERPMFELSLFSRPSFVGVSLATFCVSAGLFAALPYFTFYLQDYLGYSPLGGGLRLLPITIPAFVVPLATRSVVERVAPGALLCGGLVCCGGGLLLMLRIGVASGWTDLLAGEIVAGVGIGLANPAIARVALGVVDPRRTGMASGISNTFRTGGLAVGVATLGAIFEGSIASALGHGDAALARGLSANFRRTVAGAHVAGPLALARLEHAYLAGLHALLLVGGIVVLAGALASTSVRRRDFVAPRRSEPDTTPSASTAPAPASGRRRLSARAPRSPRR